MTPTVSAGRPTPIGHVGDAVHQPLLAVGQDQHVICADLHGPPPDPGIVLIPPNQHDPTPSPRPAHAVCRVVPDQDERGRVPALSTLGSPVVHLGTCPRRRAQPQQVIEEFHVLRDDQRPAPVRL